MTNSTKSKTEFGNSEETAVFDIHHKLKIHNPTLSYLYLAQPHESDVKYDFRVNLIEKVYSIYEKKGDYFFLIDFFSDINEACPEALRIIEDWPQAKKSILGHMEYASNN
ncbi:hypothetical protein ABW286_14195 [Erwinia papayae]|uniref:Uncharacterized protein n=1 Tax=Erwinia papayae TaxID=206499 RepID=A0ABV3N3D3_9GAMM